MKCPVCQSPLSFREFIYAEPSPCPSCHELIGVSRRYRYGLAIASLVFLFMASVYLTTLFSEVWPESWGFWVVLLIAFGATLTLSQLAGRIWPPKLEPGGDPDFLRLNLSGKQPRGPDKPDSDQSRRSC